MEERSIGRESVADNGFPGEPLSKVTTVLALYFVDAAHPVAERTSSVVMNVRTTHRRIHTQMRHTQCTNYIGPYAVHINRSKIIK
jgi:hypothetical protein